MPDITKVSRCILSVRLFMLLLALAASVAPVADLGRIAHQSTTMVSEPERRVMLVAGTPHGPIAIVGDASFSDTALLEGWDGDGSPESPYMIDGLDIDLGGGVGHCISISNTRVSFIITNCSFTGASWEGPAGTGIFLETVTNGELVKNTFDVRFGILVRYSDNCTITENTCNNNGIGICLESSNSNTVTDNTCFSNTGDGIYLYASFFNTVANNTCTSNEVGIQLYGSEHNTLCNNTCTSNNYGFYLSES
ncbi:MAG: nitrous oxide reductase family maturation protein NosD, partial [Promethearchaeota archaeon]